MDRLKEFLETATVEQKANEILKGIRLHRIIAKSIKQILELDADLSVVLTVGSLELDVIDSDAIKNFLIEELKTSAINEHDMLKAIEVIQEDEEE